MTTTRHVQDALKLDFNGLRRCYEAVEGLGDDVAEVLVGALSRLLDALDADNAWSAAGPALLRQILLVLECPALIEPEHSRVLGRLLTVAASLPSSAQHALGKGRGGEQADMRCRIITPRSIYVPFPLVESNPKPTNPQAHKQASHRPVNTL